jgi:predicted metal-binding membrane protein
MAFGLVAYAVLLGVDRMIAGAPEGLRWVGAGVLVVAGVYQLTPLKDVCLRHCRTPIGSLFRYASFQGRTRDLRVGAHHGAYCVGCCWGLMALVIALGVMNLAAMAAIAAVILVEKLWRHGVGFSRAVGASLIVAGVLAPWNQWLLPGLHAHTMGM